ncbi:MAG: hypothetical protein CMM46_06020 [Rhodospirillaceae bacterium]|nr:hypothetical protein [Rhodospirillaceae bacterium]
MSTSRTENRIDLALHTFSYEQHFLHMPGFDAHAFLAKASELGVAGVHLSLNGVNFRCAGGTSPERLAEIAADAHERDFFMECDTSGTDPDHLVSLARATRQLGGDRLRTYTRHTGAIEDVITATARDLGAAMPRVADEGVTLLLENHEDFTGQEVAALIDRVAHPALAALFDFGNSMNVLEDPLEAARAMVPHVRSVHLKDQAVISNGDGAPEIIGVVNGTGSVDIKSILALLIDDAGIERLCLESSHGYRSDIARHADRLGQTTSPTFAIREAPYAPETIPLHLDALRRSDPQALFNLEQGAVAAGMAHTRRILGELGFSPVLNSRGGRYTRGTQELAFAQRHF